MIGQHERAVNGKCVEATLMKVREDDARCQTRLRIKESTLREHDLPIISDSPLLASSY